MELSESTQAGLRCGGKTELAMTQAFNQIDEWKRKWFSNCVLMKTKSKQSRYVRIWRNK